MKTYIKFIISNYLNSLFYVFLIMFSLIFILNLLTELEFFKQIDVNSYFPIYLSLLNRVILDIVMDKSNVILLLMPLDHPLHLGNDKF